MERSTSFHVRRVFSGLFVAALSLTGITLASSAAHAATVTASYVSDADGVTTSEVTATVVDSSTSSLTGGWYLCDGVISPSLVDVTADSNLILGADCYWDSSSIHLASASLTVWGDLANTGIMYLTGSPALSVPPSSSFTTRGGSIVAISSGASAGIGGDPLTANGPITVQWRANVDATGGNSITAFAGAGAGIGGGGGTTAAIGGQNITVNTTGLVRAKGGVGSQGNGAAIGQGAGQLGAPGISTIPTVTVAAPSVSGGGTVERRIDDGATALNNQVTNAAYGSSITYLATPDNGNKVASHIGTTALGDDLFRHSIGAGSGNLGAIAFVFGPIPTNPQPDFAITPPSSTATVYGEAPFSLATTGQLSGGAVIWSVPQNNDVVSIDAATGEVTILAAGTVEVTATAPEGGGYFEATAKHTLSIATRPVTITADSLAIQFGDPFSLTWSAEPAIIEGDNLGGSLKLAGALRIGEIGIIEQNAFANPNYSVTFIPATLTVSPNDAQQAVIDAVELLPSPVTTLDQADTVATVSQEAYDSLSAEEFAALPSSTTDRLAQAQAEAATVNHTDPTIGVLASGSALPWNVRLVANRATTDSAEFTDFKKSLSGNRNLIALYDIHFIETPEGSAWQPPIGSAIEVELSQVLLAGQNDIQVQHRLVSGELETVPSALKGTRVQFSGTSFSLYGVTAANSSGLANTGSAESPKALITAAELCGAAAGLLLIAANRWRRSRREY